MSAIAVFKFACRDRLSSLQFNFSVIVIVGPFHVKDQVNMEGHIFDLISVSFYLRCTMVTFGK